MSTYLASTAIKMNNILSIIFIFGLGLSSAHSLSGDNVCTRPNPTNSSITESYCCTGYVANGDVCNRCQPFFFGNDCMNSCTCVQANTDNCDNVIGTCSCLPGYKGTNCETACDVGFYGLNCAMFCSFCDITNIISWNSISGEYSCRPGYQFPNCTTKCDDGYYGLRCSMTCMCPPNAFSTCDKKTGTCTCKPGYIGSRCYACPDGRYGEGCANTCSCPPNAYVVCNNENGTCTCLPGWTGAMCDNECPDGTYGLGCLNTCTCPLNAFSVCEKNSGQCTCLPGFGGDNCNTACKEWTFGSGCFGRCQCQRNETISCSRETGECECMENYAGVNCSVFIGFEMAQRSDDIATIIGGTFGFLTFILIAVIALWVMFRLRKRGHTLRRRQEESSKEHSRNSDMAIEPSGELYRNVVYEDEAPSTGEPAYENVEAENQYAQPVRQNAVFERNLYESLQTSTDNHLYERFQKNK